MDICMLLYNMVLVKYIFDVTFTCNNRKSTVSKTLKMYQFFFSLSLFSSFKKLSYFKKWKWVKESKIEQNKGFKAKGNQVHNARFKCEESCRWVK